MPTTAKLLARLVESSSITTKVGTSYFISGKSASTSEDDEIYISYNPEFLHKFLVSHNFKLIKKFKFPFTTWEDRLYTNLEK